MKEFQLRIETDEDAQNPRKDFDQVGKMACWHRRYNLGDEQPSESPEDYLDSLANDVGEYSDIADRCLRLTNYFWGRPGWVSRIERIQNEARTKALEEYVIMPLYLYDHSGITISTGSFGCPWDSGQVGFIYCTLKKALEEWGAECSKDWDDPASYRKGPDDLKKYTVREAAIGYLESEVETYDQYLTGDVHGYIIESREKGSDDEWEHEESCWGFFGEDYCREEGESVLKHCQEQEAKEERKRKAQARHYRKHVEPFLAACEI